MSKYELMEFCIVCCDKYNKDLADEMINELAELLVVEWFRYHQSTITKTF